MIKKIIAGVFLIANVYLALSSSALAREAFVYEDKGNRDPFVPLVRKASEVMSGKKSVEREKKTMERIESTIKVEGILWSSTGEGESMAIINGKLYKYGDSIYGFKLIKIEQNWVVLESDGNEYKIERKKKK